MVDLNRGFWRNAWTVLSDAVGHLNADDGWAMASNVALSVLMALFPFLIFVAAVAGTVGDARLADRVAEMMFTAWPPGVAGPIADEVRRVLRPAHGSLLTVSAAVALFLATSGVEAVRTALNRAYRVVDRRSFIRLRLQSLFFVFVGTLIILLLTAVVAAATSLPIPQPFASMLRTVGAGVTSVLLVAVLFAAHLWLPAGRPPWQQLWPGIVATLVLWAISAWAFAYYLRSFANYAATYAGLAGVVTAIFFLYIVSVVLIFGAEFNAAIRRLRDRAI